MTARQTVDRPTERFHGIGLHSGLPSWLQILPAEIAGVGIIFRSWNTGVQVEASWRSVVSTNRSTCLGSVNTRVETVEHVLSALYGCSITDAIVLYEGTELPIGDGSSLPFLKLIESVGLRILGSTIDELTTDREIVVSDKTGAVITAVPSETFWITATIDYSDYADIGIQSASYKSLDYGNSIAPARTYGFYHELEKLRSAGLGKGVTLENVVALDETGNPDARTPLRMKDELVRHKILDLIGDLSLTQKKLQFGVIALKPSHYLNVCLTKALLRINCS